MRGGFATPRSALLCGSPPSASQLLQNSFFLPQFPLPQISAFPLSHFCCLHPSHLPAPSPSLPPASQALSSLFTHTAPSPSPTPPPPLDAWAAGITHARKLLTLQLCDPSVNNTGLAAQSLLLLCGLQRPKSKTPLLPLPFGRLVPPPHPN